LSDGQQYFYFVRARDTLLNTTVWSASTSSTQDNAAPTGWTFTINNNATATSGANVTLNTTCATDAWVGGVQVAWGNTANPTNWTTCSASIAHTLSAWDGTKTVYMQFRDSLGNISTQISDTIIVDTTAPTGWSFTINFDDPATNTLAVNLWTTCATDWSGVWGVQVAYGTGTTPINWTSCVWNIAIGYSLPTPDGTKTLYIRFRDSLGNMTTALSDDIVLDQTAPIWAAMVAEPTFTSGTVNTVIRTNASDGTGVWWIAYQFCRNTTNTTASWCVLSSWTGATAITHTWLVDGQIYYYFVRARDSLTNTSPWSSSTSSTQDSFIPTTTIIPNGSTCITWTANITLTCNDAWWIWCVTTQYKIVNAEETCDTVWLNDYTGVIALSGSSVKKICYRSIDGLNNTEVMQTSNTFTLSNTTYYQDSDGDGYGNTAVSQSVCTPPVWYVTTTWDCLDTDARVNPTTIWYSDDDADGFSDGVTQTTCTDPGATWYISHQLIWTANTAHSLNLTSGLVGHWSFDGANGNDESGNGNNGITNWWIQYTWGKMSKSSLFYWSGDFFAYPKNLLFNRSTLSIWAWFKTTDWNWWIITEYHNSSAYGYQIVIHNNLLKACVGTTPNDSTCSSNNYQLSTTWVVNNNTWYFATLTYNWSNVKLYLNWQEVANANKTWNIQNNWVSYWFIWLQWYNIWWIYYPQTAWYLSWSIDDVRMYDRALSATEIQKLYTLTDKAQAGDCLDTNGTRHPLAVEVCDGVDNDCDGQIDEGVQTTYYQDLDADVYGNSAVTTGACSVPTGYAATGTDCNDTDARVNPATIWYTDADTDGFSSGSTQTTCTDPGATRYLPSELVTTSASGANLRNGLVVHTTFDRRDARNNGTSGTWYLCTNNWLLSWWIRLDWATHCINNTGHVFITWAIEKWVTLNGVNQWILMPSYISTNQSVSKFARIKISSYPASWFKYIFGANSGVWSLIILPNWSLSEWNVGITSNANAVPLNTWVHVWSTVNFINTGNILFTLHVNWAVVKTGSVSVGANPYHVRRWGIGMANHGSNNYNYSWFSGSIDDARIYNRRLSAEEVNDLYISTNQYATGDCLDSNGVINPLTKRYKDVDGDGYSDGTMLMQCTQPANYKLATNLIATTWDCLDTDARVNPTTIWYSDDDADGFSDGVTQTTCTDPGATWYISHQLIWTANTAHSLNLTSGLVGHWSFDGANGNDESGNWYTATLTGWVIFTGGKLGKWVSFDGNGDWIDLSNNLWYNTQVSAFAWFKANGSPAWWYHIILGWQELEISIPTAWAIRVGLYTNTRFVSNHWGWLTDGNWHFIWLTYDGMKKRAYIDWVYVWEQDVSWTLTSLVLNRRIGRFGSDSTYYANGNIDDVRIYNRALSATEIQKLYTLTDKAQAGDCVDTNWLLHPLVTEVCDWVDNDCDGQIDEGLLTTYYQDLDADTYWNSSVSTGACTLPLWYTTTGADCNDTDARLNPATIWYTDADTDWFSSWSTQVVCIDPGATRYLPGELVTTSTSGANLRNGLVGNWTLDQYYTQSNEIWNLSTLSWWASASKFTFNILSWPEWSMSARRVTDINDATYPLLRTYVWVLTWGNYEFSIWAKSADTNAATWFTLDISDKGMKTFVPTSIWTKYTITISVKDFPLTLEWGNHFVDIAYGNTQWLAVDFWWASFRRINTTTPDFSVNGFTGSVDSLPVMTWGKIEKAFWFDGLDDAISIDNATWYTFATGNFSVSSWFKTSATVNTDANIYALMWKDSWSIGNLGRWLSLRGGAYRGIVFRVAAPAIFDVIPTTDLKATVSNGNRHQVTAVLHRWQQLMSLYLDWQLVGTTAMTATGSLLSSTNTFTIGKTMSASVFAFSGAIDDTRIYNRALSAYEVEQLYKATNQYTNGDCADAVSTRNPLAAEICDGIDNNCNGSIDEGVVSTYWKDFDDDFWSDGVSATGCVAGSGYGLPISPLVAWYQPSLSGGLLAYYTFDTASGTNDSSWFGRHWTGQWWLTYGTSSSALYATALNFDGINDNVIINIPHPYAFTKSAWIKPDITACNASTEWRCTILWPYFEIVWTHLQFYSYELTNQGWHSANNVLLNNQWQYVTVSFDGSKLRMYHNSILKYEIAVTQKNLIANTTSIWSFNQWWGRPFFWQIDDIRVYDRALSNDQIAALYTGNVRFTTGDCNDNNAVLNWSTRRYKDIDNDGYSDGTILVQCTQPLNYKLATNLTSITGDCLDTNWSVNPWATEICDGIDNDCDGTADEWLTSTYYQDSDGDSYGNPAVSTWGAWICTVPIGYTGNNTDCVDTDAIQKPWQTWYKDADGDNYGDATTWSVVQCIRPINHKAAVELTGTNTDCNDAAANTYPWAFEIPDGIDQNCVNDSPTLSAITSPQTTNEDVLKTVVITVLDVDNVLNCSGSVSLTSSNSTLITPATIAKSWTPPICTLTLYPIANQNGTSTIWVTVTDWLLNTWLNFTFSVTSVNDAPSSVDNTVMALESTTYIFWTGDFPFTDPNDNPVNPLSSVIVQSIPWWGVMRRSGALVTAGQTITVADIIAGNLTYAPNTWASGQWYASFWFRVVDNGGTANGWVNTDQSANTLTIDVVWFSINSWATATATSGVTLTNIVCPAWTDIARGNTTNPANWTTCTSSKTHSLSVWDGNKTVYMRRRTSGAVISQNLSKSILLDTTAPVWWSFIINANATWTNTTWVTLNTTCATDAWIWWVQVAYGNITNPTNWTTCTNTMSHTLTGVDGTKTVYMLFKDSLNNTITTALTDTIVLDRLAPITTINPNGATCSTWSTMVSLSCNDWSWIWCASMQYKIVNNGITCDTTNLITYTWAFVMNGIWIRKVCYRATDNVTNTEIIQTSANFTVSNTVYYQDSDGDGFGNPWVTQVACGTPVGYTWNNTDCVDTDPKQKPGQIWWKDADGDNYGDELTWSIIQCLRPINYKIATEMTVTWSDCNDTLFTVNPGVSDIVANGVDDNCDWLETCYLDADLDNHGTTATTWTTVLSCIASWVSLLSDDCDDLVSTTYPGAPEICDGLNNDCDLITDEKPDWSICTICERIDLTIPQNECESLRAIYTWSNWLDWDNNNNWLTSVDVETWDGVWVVSGHVDSLSLSDNSLVWTLWTWLRLPKLTSLDISSNQWLNINSVWQLTGLSFLNIANMNLNALPVSISALQTLDIFYAQNNALTTIITSLNQLTDLNIIDLSNNLINAIWTQFQNLNQLTVLDLSDNQITVVPANALQWVSVLEELDMAWNLITSIPSSLTASAATLQRVNFADNAINSLPTASFFNQFGALRIVNLSENMLSTIGSIANLSNLTTLDIRWNQMTQMPAWIQALVSLDHVILNDNLLTTGLTLVAQITWLQTFYAQNNDFTGLIPQGFDQMNTLSVLSLQNNNLDRENTHHAKSSHLNATRRDRPWFAKDVSNQSDITAPTMIWTWVVEPLSLLYIEYNFAWSENSYAVTTWWSWMSMIYSGWWLCNYLESDPIMSWVSAQTIVITSTTWWNYSWCTVQLRDHANNLSAPVILPTFFLSVNLADMCLHPNLTIPQSECLVLVELFSGTNGLSWTNRSWWFKTANVENWFGVRTTSGPVGDLLRHVDGIFLQKSSWIDDHDLSNISSWNGNKLIWKLPSTLWNLPYLKDLNVSKNTISGQIPSSITQLTWLQQVWMRNNVLNGTLPTNWAGLTQLKVIDINVNQLTGTIPVSLWTITWLLRLDLWSNQLIWTIPASFGNLKALNALILWTNQLQWSIPQELGNATWLQFLDLRNNNFVGTVPNSFTQLVGIVWTTNKWFYIDGNALNRNIWPNHEAILSSSIEIWYNSLTNKWRLSQRDITPPVISWTGTVPLTIPTSWVITYAITVNENSYPVNNLGQGMQSVFWPAGTCSSLSGSRVTINTGSITLTIQPIQPGVYENCTLQIRDRGTNLSNIITLPMFTYELGEASICFNQDISIPLGECIALSDFYKKTNGEQRTNDNNWFTTWNVENWFGVNTVFVNWKYRVSELLLHRNDLTSSGDATFIQGATGNNLSGELTTNFASLPYLTLLRLDYNKLQWSLPSSIWSVTWLTVLTLGHNKLSWTLPQTLSWLVQLKQLTLNNNLLQWTIPNIFAGMSALTNVNLNYNQLNTWLSNLFVINSLQTLQVANNLFQWVLPSQLSVLWSLKEVDLSANQFTGTLPTNWSALSNLESLSVSSNTLTWTIPSSWTALSKLKKVNLANTDLWWNIGITIPSWQSIQTINIQNNNFVGTFTNAFENLTWLTSLLVNNNYLDRTLTHDAYVHGDLEQWIDWITIKNLSNQWDRTAPILNSSDPIYSPVNGNIPYTFTVNENSYAITATWAWMAVTISWWSLCQSMYFDPKQILINSWTISATFYPVSNGLYNCKLIVTDHGGNNWILQIPIFSFDSTCGNGIQNAGETCDEWSQCDNGVSCTNNPWLCPGECRPRMTNNCNPSCEASSCGDRYVDVDGIDASPTANYDDETCDVGSYCNNGTDCTRDPSICANGAFECRPRALNWCSPTCTQGTCGDGAFDPDGPDNTFWTPDDEQCDDGNLQNGDSCSANCREEYCGDGYRDSNWKDDNINTLADNEQCDLGPNNGLLGWLCSSTCTLPADECVFCYETCDGGEGAHNIFLLIDVSWSMQNNNRLANAKAGAINFINLVASWTAVNPNFTTKIWLIKFSDVGTIVVNPTTGYSTVKTAINNLTANGATNFGDPIQKARQYFIDNPPAPGYKQHIILLSDGEPTVWWTAPYEDPGARAIYQAWQAKAWGMFVYTIAVDLDDQWLEYMSYMSSSTKLNQSWVWPWFNKPVRQSSTISPYSASRAVDANKSNYSLTTEEYQARREINMNNQINIEKINVWNRTSQTSETADFRVHVSQDPFVSGATLNDILADTNIESRYVTWAAWRPSIISLWKQWQYVRVQLSKPAPSAINYQAPTNIPWLKIWLDGKDIDADGLNNDNPANGAAVTSWLDKSWNGNHPTLSTNLVYDTSSNLWWWVYVDRDGSRGILFNNSAITSWTIIYVAEKDGNDTDWLIMRWVSSSSYFIGAEWNRARELRINAAPNLWSPPATTSTNEDPHIYHFETNGSQYVYNDIGNFVASGNNNSIASITWATNSYGASTSNSTDSDHVIAEFMVFSKVLTLAERQQVEWYLANKRWMLDSLPTGHPYKPTASANTVNLWLAEIEIIWCDISDPTCTDKFHYKDYAWITLNTLYGHVFWSIHCDCSPEQVCGICGDGVQDATKGEQCDEWSYCDDWNGVAWTSCTHDPNICASQWKWECKPRYTEGCTNTCKDYYCGDGIVEFIDKSCVTESGFTGDACLNSYDCDFGEYCAWITITGNYITSSICLTKSELTQCSLPATEVCDDGNNLNGDGCSSLCVLEWCGDSLLDNNWPDDVFWTSDDEECDDGNAIWWDGCNAVCRVENKCGDYFVDSDGPDNLTGTYDDETCDTWTYCDEAATVSCVSNAQCINAWYPPNSCKPRFKNGCTPNCNYGVCGDTRVDADGWDNNPSSESDNEECDDGMYCISGPLAWANCSFSPDLCPWVCTQVTNNNCTNLCKDTYCGDWFTQYNNDEECDDANTIDTDLCDNSCKLTNITFCPAEYLTQCDDWFTITYMDGQWWFCLKTEFTGAIATP
jgi:cysteine-rich repeat protein